MDVRDQRSTKNSLSDNLGAWANRWWPVAIITFGAVAFLIVLPHQYTYHW